MAHRTCSSRCSARPGNTLARRSGPTRCLFPRRLRSRRWRLSAPAETTPGRRRPGVLLIGSLLYLSVIFGVMLWRGISIEPEWVVLALLVIAIALGRGKTFIADWAPFLLLFFAYEAMRGFAAKTGFAPHNLAGLERAVFGGTLPTLTLQHAFYRVETVSPPDVVAMFFYFMHFPMPILVGCVFWLRSREHYIVDALDGFLYVAVATALVEGFVRWRDRRAGASASSGQQ